MTEKPRIPSDSCLLIRVWTEPDAPNTVRARVLSQCGDGEPVSVATAASEDAVIAAVRQWVRAQVPAVPLLPTVHTPLARP